MTFADMDVTLLRPFWLLALLPLGGVGWWLLSRQGGLEGWNRAADPDLLKAMAALGRIDSGVDRAPVLAGLVAAGLAILALSGPAVERRGATSFRNLDAAVLVVDASQSVTGHARWPQMVAMGRFAISALGTRPGGLVVFAGDAYTATDMTTDHRQLGQTLSLIDAETVPDKGSRPALGLARAAAMLRDSRVIAGDVVLFTDGAGLGPDSLQQVSALTDLGARLSIVSLDAVSPLSETHSASGSGRSFTLDQTDDLARWMRADARTRLEQQDYPLLYWRDLGRFVLALSLVPLLVLFRRPAL